ncbi:MFS transporter [Nocardioides gilvus]|uniref:MFS transporter n=1 Tax=Nocardioides gilvus TaxID=1735589 RepID=UPI000D741827|nr:MFS transporter [Nocardioides gilvus]
MKRVRITPSASTSVSPLAAALICALGMGCVMYEQTSLVVSAPVIIAEFGAGLSGLQWLTALFPLVAASAMPLSGLLGQRIGSRATVQWGLVVIVAGAALAALAPSLAVLLGARVIQGVGAALVLPNSATLLGANVHDPVQRTRAIGIWMTAGTSTLLFGPLLGGTLAEHVGWRATFVVWIPVAILALILLRRLDSNPRATAGRVDLLGLLLACTTLALVAWSLIASGRHGAEWRWICAAAVAAVLLGTAFVWVERRVRHPLLDFAVFRPRRLRMLLLACFTYNAAINGTAILISVHFQDQRGLSATTVGLMFMVANLGMPLAGLLVPLLRRHRDNVELMVVGLWALALAYLWLGTGAGWHPVLLGVPLALIGLGAGVLYFVDTNTVLDQVSGPETASTMAALALMRQIGSVMGIAALASLGQWTTTLGLSAHPAPPALLIAGSALAIIAVIGTRWVLRRDPGPEVGPTQP